MMPHPRLYVTMDVTCLWPADPYDHGMQRYTTFGRHTIAFGPIAMTAHTHTIVSGLFLVHGKLLRQYRSKYNPVDWRPLRQIDGDSWADPLCTEAEKTVR